MSDEVHDVGEVADGGRRDFLKKAGAVAWVVPTLQIVNMASASAGVDGSVVTTTRPPSSTTKPPCESRYYKMTAIWYCRENGVGLDNADECDGYWKWISEDIGNCLDHDFHEHVNPGDRVRIGGDRYGAKVYHEMRGCEIRGIAGTASEVEHDAARNAPPERGYCVEGHIADPYNAYVELPQADGNGDHGLYLVEVIVKCCEKDMTRR